MKIDNNNTKNCWKPIQRRLWQKKSDIRSRYPEPYASMFCQQFDNFKNIADFFEFAAKLMKR